MQFQRVNRDNAEIGFGMATNVDGQTITKGYPACITTGSGSNTGYAVVQPRANALKTFFGIAQKDVADTGVGRFIVYGYAVSTFVYAHAASVTIAAGEAMGIGAAGSLGVSSTGLLDSYGPVLALEAVGAAVTSPGGYVQALVRAL